MHRESFYHCREFRLHLCHDRTAARWEKTLRQPALRVPSGHLKLLARRVEKESRP